ncbi:hypothetical protein PLIIFM63780_009817 [Purpureocillium lilacinum]|nr:hypothetical protein PLIIFM63780_009817 [Purpureocillium lilacinum]
MEPNAEQRGDRAPPPEAGKRSLRRQETLIPHLRDVEFDQPVLLSIYSFWTLSAVCAACEQLPPLVQARELFNHFAQICQPNWGVLHVPSARALLERTYKARGAAGQQGPVQQSPAAEDLLLLFSIFAAAAFNWTPSLLEGLKATPAEAKAAFAGYNTIAMSILDNDVSSVKPSTTALAALSNLAHLSTNSRGLSDNVLLLRLKCLLMARSMGVDRLDTRKSREERAQKGCNIIELEVQRRVWWNLVGFDWLNSFPGSPREGTYVIQPRHMNIGLPSNAPDELITEERAEDLPLSVPTPMTAFIYRVKLAEVCRKAVDTLPSVSHDTEDVDYSVVLELDSAFNDFLRDLPWFFRLDESSMAQSAEVCKQQPMLAVHRVGINFSAQTRLCRLHRPYHLMDPSSDARHAYSRTACIRAAYTVLELRRAMDDIGARVGIRPARSWIVMQHVFIAALILATDVSRDPDAAGADARRAKVLAACEVLERSTEESGALMEGVQRNLQALMAALRERKQEPPSGQQRMGDVAVGRPSTRATVAAMDDNVGEDAADETLGAYEAGAAEAESEEMQGSGGTASSDDQNMDLLWTEFLNIAPDLDVPQWDMLLDDIELPSFAP